MAAVLVTSLTTPTAALADHSFILPSVTNVSGNDPIVTFDAAGSEHVFFFDHRPMQLEAITVTKPDGTPGAPYNALRQRFRSVFDVKLDQPGTWKIASRQTMVMGSFKLNGEERRVGGRGGPPPGAGMGGSPGGPAGVGDRGPDARGPDGDRRQGGPASAAPAGAPGGGEQGGPRRQPPVALKDIPAEATDIHLTEMVNTVETFVTSGAPSDTVLKPTGKGLEMAPVTHPNSVAAGETARLRFLIDGKPAPNVKVTVIAGGDRYREDEGAMMLATGADGTVAIKWPAAGMYWLGAEAEDASPTEKRAEKRRMTYAATFEVATP